MSTIRYTLFLAVSFIALIGRGQDPVGSAMTRIQGDSALAHLKNDLARDPLGSIHKTDTLLQVFRRLGVPCSIAEIYGLRSTSYSQLGMYDSAMGSAQRVFKLFTSECDSAILLRGYVAMSRLYRDLGDVDKVDSLCAIGMSIWRPEWHAEPLRNSLLTNKAIASAQRGDIGEADRAFHTILRFAMKEGHPQDIGDAETNIGALKIMAGELDSAEFYYTAALEQHRRSAKANSIAADFHNMASIHARKQSPRTAITLLDSALYYSRKAGDLPLEATVQRAIADDYRDLGEHAAAYDHLDLYRVLQDSILNTEKVKALTEMQEKYESEKKAKEILGLRAENLQGELEKARVKRTRNVYLFTGLGVVCLSIGLWNTLRRTRRSRAAIQHEKEISEGLLHNILPVEVADEIKAKGFADVKEFPKATVLFTDFKGFTTLSEKLSASDLVAEIDHCFKAFDGIMEKYGIEKIKTIGDAYMAAGGLPDTTKGSPIAVVRAALEMQAFMRAYKGEREAQGRLFFEMRVGVHTGPVIAGIVGVKKFAYDIWGDTVNTASRMESSGEVGKVNISGSTYELVKDEPGLAFVPRGLVQAKGKGEMTMFFVEPA